MHSKQNRITQHNIMALLLKAETKLKKTFYASD